MTPRPARRAWLMLVPLSLAAMPLHAEEKTDCRDRRYTADFNFCADQAFAAADRKLNAAYRKVHASLPEDDRKTLLDTQREWLKLRDRHCDLETKETLRGTVWGQVHQECKTRLTLARTIDIESLLLYR